MGTHTLVILDYVIFGLVLVASTVIGLFFGFKNRKKMTSTEYLVGNRNLPWFPISISLVVSFLSSVSVMKVTAHIYYSGITYLFVVLAFLISIILNAMIFAPLFRKLQITSVNEYLELRFSKGIRLLGCSYLTLQYLLFLGIVLYIPSAALEAVAGIPMIASVIVTGAICTIYTTYGGMRGIIYVDVFQSVVMVTGLIVIAIFGVLKVKSMSEVLKDKFNRFEIEYNPDPRHYHTVWGLAFGATFSLFSAWTIGQPTVQRVVSARSLSDSRKALSCSIAIILLMFILLAFDGIIIFNVFNGCDPVKLNILKTPAQIFPYFIVDQFKDWMGVPGLLISCLICFSLSTLSSALNSVAAVVLEDIVKSCKPTITETWQIAISKVVVSVFGILVTGLTIAIPKAGTNVIKLLSEMFGIIGGPYFGMFVMGIFTRRANSAGAAIGSLVGLGVGVSLAVGQLYYPPDKQLPLLSMGNCTNVSMSNAAPAYPEPQKHNHIIADIVSISYTWHSLITIFITFAVGMLCSLCFSRCCDSTYLDNKLLFHCKRCGCSCTCCQDDNKNEYDCEVYDQELIQSGPFADRSDEHYRNSDT